MINIMLYRFYQFFKIINVDTNDSVCVTLYVCTHLHSLPLSAERDWEVLPG